MSHETSYSGLRVQYVCLCSCVQVYIRYTLRIEERCKSKEKHSNAINFFNSIIPATLTLCQKSKTSILYHFYCTVCHSHLEFAFCTKSTSWNNSFLRLHSKIRILAKREDLRKQESHDHDSAHSSSVGKIVPGSHCSQNKNPVRRKHFLIESVLITVSQMKFPRHLI